jgi:thiol-disulfide isomerase/thioredoxin
MPLKKILLFFNVLGILYFENFPKALAIESLDLAATKVQTLTQTPTMLKDKFTGEVLLLDFWASWCGPCKKSLPFYEQLQKRYTTQGLQVLALSVDDESKDATAFILKNNFSLTFLWDQNRTLAKSLSLKAIPTTLILDKAGKIHYQERGFSDSSKAKIEEQILKLFKKNK